MERARMRKARNMIFLGLALFLLVAPTVGAGHFIESPAPFSQTTGAFDTAAVRGIATRNSTGPNDVPTGLVGWTNGDAAAFQALVVSGLFRAFGNATQPQASVRGVEIFATGNSTAEAATVGGIVVGTSGNAQGLNSLVCAVCNFADGSATGDGARVMAIEARAGGSAVGPNSLVRGATINTTGNATGSDSAVQSIRVRALGNAVGTNSGVTGVGVTAEGVATGSGSEIRAVRASTLGASGPAVAVLATTSSTSGRAVDARAEATSGNIVAVRGQTNSPQGIGIHGIANNPAGLAGKFDGRVQINCPSRPCLTVQGHNVGDLAENMAAVGRAEPGDVVVLTQGRDTKWGVTRANRAYDTRVAGIVSTQPRILFKVDGQRTVPIAMVGIVTAKATASNGTIRVGDLLTTSPIPGRLMRCSTPARCIGAVVAKALEPLRSGSGTILVLVWRQ